METKIEVFGTIKNGSFIAKITYGENSFWAYHPGHINNCLMLHRIPDYVTRFVVFSENDETMHENCRAILLRKDLKLDDQSNTGLELIFREAMDIIRNS